jgi:predicted nucleic acid-binding protein
LTYLRAPHELSERARERLGAVLPEQVFISVVTLYALCRMNHEGTVTESEIDVLLERIRPEQVLEIDIATRLLADSLNGPLELRLIAATARRRRLTLLARTNDYDGYNINVIFAGRMDMPREPTTREVVC